MTNTKKKILVMCIVMIATVTTFVCSTIAYFTDSSAIDYGEFMSGTSSVEIVDITYPYGSNIPTDSAAAIRIMPGYDISKIVTARNTGSLPLYVRVKLESDITLAEFAAGRESEIDLSLVSCNINGEYWVYHEGYYYYRSSLVSGNEAMPLFTKVHFDENMGNLYKDSQVVFRIDADAIQADYTGASPLTVVGWPERMSE